MRLLAVIALALALAGTAQAQCDSYTKLMLHGDGPNASTNIVDSAFSNTISVIGNAQLLTNAYKFGGASISCDGSGDYLIVSNNANYKIGTNDFTVDAWIKLTSDTGYRSFFYFGDGANATSYVISLRLNDTKHLQAQAYFGGTNALSIIDAGTITNNEAWAHVAFVRSTTNFFLFKNGSLVGQTNTAGVATVNDSTQPIIFGCLWVRGQPYAELYSWWNGYIDEARFSVGVARWTAAFTPPTSAYCAEVAQTSRRKPYLQLHELTTGATP